MSKTKFCGSGHYQSGSGAGAHQTHTCDVIIIWEWECLNSELDKNNKILDLIDIIKQGRVYPNSKLSESHVSVFV